jgi:small conductance mechanosensitive channel
MTLDFLAVPPSILKVLGLALGWVIGTALINSLGVHYLKVFLIKAQDQVDRSKKEKEQRAKTITTVARTTAILGLTVIGGMIGMSALGFDIGPLIAGAGIAGLAIGFGAQSLVKDFINGLFILLEDQFGIGDVINVGDISGTVQEFNLRRTVLRDIDGIEHHIPNSEISILSNMTKDWSRLVVPIGISYEADLDKAIKVLEQVSKRFSKEKNFKDIFIEEPQVQAVNELADSAVVLRVLAKVQEGQQWGAKRQLLYRIKKAFDKAGIEIPYPHITVTQK